VTQRRDGRKRAIKGKIADLVLGTPSGVSCLSKLFPSLYCDFFCAASAAALSSARAPLRISSIA
jgi:hypothetical protein